MNSLIFLSPVFKETIWGGTRLRTAAGFDIPNDHTGENWCISAHPHGDCQIANGKYQGKTLSWLYTNHRELFGNLSSAQFPVLIKWIDANEHLSVQVHPDDQYAKKNEGSIGKSECWYVIDCDEGAQMVMGHRASSKEEIKKAIALDHYDELLNTVIIHPGEFYWIPSGTLHAICKGSLIYEVQQSSDITYRVYDYHRKDANGNERELHIQKSLDVISVPSTGCAIAPKFKNDGDLTQVNFIDNELFRITKFTLDGSCCFINDEPMRMITVLEGEGSCNQQPIRQGDSFIIPATVSTLNYQGKMIWIETLLGGKLNERL